MISLMKDQRGIHSLFLLASINKLLTEIILSRSENLKPSESVNNPRWYVLRIMDQIYVDQPNRHSLALKLALRVILSITDSLQCKITHDNVFYQTLCMGFIWLLRGYYIIRPIIKEYLAPLSYMATQRAQRLKTHDLFQMSLCLPLLITCSINYIYSTDCDV